MYLTKEFLPHEAKTDRTETRNRQIHNYRQKLFNTCLTISDRTWRQRISKHIELNNDVNQLEVIDIYRTFYPITGEHTVFPSECETLTKTDHILQI